MKILQPLREQGYHISDSIIGWWSFLEQLLLLVSSSNYWRISILCNTAGQKIWKILDKITRGKFNESISRNFIWTFWFSTYKNYFQNYKENGRKKIREILTFWSGIFLIFCVYNWKWKYSHVNMTQHLTRCLWNKTNNPETSDYYFALLDRSMNTLSACSDCFLTFMQHES